MSARPPRASTLGRGLSALIPQAVAYGSLAGVSPSTSLTIAAIPLVVYMLLGRNPYMSLGPESTVALMAAAAVAPVATAYNVPWTTALSHLGSGGDRSGHRLAAQSLIPGRPAVQSPPQRLSDRGLPS